MSKGTLSDRRMHEIETLLLVGFGYVSCNLNVTLFMKYDKSSAPPTISESGALAALRTPSVHR